MELPRGPSPGRPAASRSKASSRSGYNSRAPSRPRASRNSSRASVAYLPQGGESLIIPDGPIGEEATELLQEFVNPHHDRSHISEQEDGAGDNASDTASIEQRKKLPWYKRPSPLWCVQCPNSWFTFVNLISCRFLLMVPVAASATAATLAPKVEIYTQLACATHRPEYRSDNGTLPATYAFAEPG